MNIVAGENASDSYDYKMVKKSGFGALGGFSFGTRQQTDWVDGKKVFHTASTVGSVEGNVLINAGNGLNVVGSNVIARQGDVTLIGQQVNIVAALDTARSKEFHEIKQSGLSVTASNPVVSAVQTGERMASAASKVDNPVMQPGGRHGWFGGLQRLRCRAEGRQHHRRHVYRQSRRGEHPDQPR